jgi:hypothetical protein
VSRLQNKRIIENGEEMVTERDNLLDNDSFSKDDQKK